MLQIGVFHWRPCTDKQGRRTCYFNWSAITLDVLESWCTKRKKSKYHGTWPMVKPVANKQIKNLKGAMMNGLPRTEGWTYWEGGWMQVSCALLDIFLAVIWTAMHGKRGTFSLWEGYAQPVKFPQSSRCEGNMRKPLTDIYHHVSNIVGQKKVEYLIKNSPLEVPT